MDEPALQSIELSKLYRKFAAMHKVSFGVNQQDVFGLIGPNGAGKSTLTYEVDALRA